MTSPKVWSRRRRGRDRSLEPGRLRNWPQGQWSEPERQWKSGCRDKFQSINPLSKETYTSKRKMPPRTPTEDWCPHSCQFWFFKIKFHSLAAFPAPACALLPPSPSLPFPYLLSPLLPLLCFSALCPLAPCHNPGISPTVWLWQDAAAPVQGHSDDDGDDNDHSENPWRQNMHKYYTHLSLGLDLYLWFVLGNYSVFSVYLPDFVSPLQQPQVTVTKPCTSLWRGSSRRPHRASLTCPVQRVCLYVVLVEVCCW